MADWDNNGEELWREDDGNDVARQEHESAQAGVEDSSDNSSGGEEMLDSVEEFVAAPRNAKTDDFTWKDMADFANFAIAFHGLSDTQKHLLAQLAGVRKNADAADIGAALMKNSDSVEALNVLAPTIEKVVYGTAGMMEGVALAAGISSLSDGARLSILKVVNEALNTVGESSIRWTKNAGAEALSSKVVESFVHFADSEQVLSLVTVLRDITAMWPGER